MLGLYGRINMKRGLTLKERENPMAIVYQCKMCGGKLRLPENGVVAECEYCGSVQTVPTADNEKKIVQFERAEHLRKQCEFDKASSVYEAILADFRQEAEAYWGLVLCKYGIEYVETNGRRVPTCHRSSFSSIMNDGDYKLAVQYADESARVVYMNEAEQLEEIRKGIVEVSGKEKPYDVFICYKESDGYGQRTLDSVIAQDIYDALTDRGYRVFFSRITLEDKLGQQYEPYIFAALNSARIMLVVGTNSAHMNAVWVKNEWSRYLKVMEQEDSRYLIPCYKGMCAYDMPQEFHRLQAQDMDKLGAMQDLLHGVEKLLPIQSREDNRGKIADVLHPMLERIEIFLEDGDFDSADEYCEKVLDIDPKNAQAYLGKLMVQRKLHKLAHLGLQEEPFTDNPFYLRALQYATPALADQLRAYDACVCNRKKGQKKPKNSRRRMRKWMKFWMIVCYALSFIYIDMQIFDALAVFGLLGTLFLCLGYTPKGSKNLFGKEKGIHKQLAIWICVIIVFLIILNA